MDKKYEKITNENDTLKTNNPCFCSPFSNKSVEEKNKLKEKLLTTKNK